MGGLIDWLIDSWIDGDDDYDDGDDDRDDDDDDDDDSYYHHVWVIKLIHHISYITA